MIAEQGLCTEKVVGLKVHLWKLYNMIASIEITNTEIVFPKEPPSWTFERVLNIAQKLVVLLIQNQKIGKHERKMRLNMKKKRGKYKKF